EGVPEVELGAFWAEWQRLPKEDREPPLFIFAGQNEVEASLVVETEYWTRVGGPMPYHDSYTYSFYSGVPIGDAIMKRLAEANEGKWNLNPQPLKGLATSP